MWVGADYKWPIYLFIISEWPSFKDAEFVWLQSVNRAWLNQAYHPWHLFPSTCLLFSFTCSFSRHSFPVFFDVLVCWFVLILFFNRRNLPCVNTSCMLGLPLVCLFVLFQKHLTVCTLILQALHHVCPHCRILVWSYCSMEGMLRSFSPQLSVKGGFLKYHRTLWQCMVSWSSDSLSVLKHSVKHFGDGDCKGVVSWELCCYTNPW